MAAKHGARHCYIMGCRCDDCKAANRDYQRDLRARQQVVIHDPVRPHVVESTPPTKCSEHLVVSPGVEAGVMAEISGLAAGARPGLAQVALAMARILDNPKAVAQQPAAAKVLAGLLEKVRSASARGRRGHLAVVRTMTEVARGE